MEKDAAKMVQNSEVGPQMEALVQPDTEAGAGGTKRPLSSFAKTQVTGEAFRPMLEVNRFVWPKATDAMLDRIGQSVQKFAQGLIHSNTKGGQLVLFSTASSSAGGSTMMLCLARCLSRMGRKVSMVDADVSHPSLARDVGVAPQIGWENVLKGELPLVEVLIESVLDGITLLPLRECQTGDAELMANLHAGVSLEILRQHYDVILVDAGHGDGASRPANLLLRVAPFQTAVVVVDGRGSDSLPAAQRVVSTMRQSVKQVRLVENFAKPNDLTRQGTKARNPKELSAA